MSSSGLCFGGSAELRAAVLAYAADRGNPRSNVSLTYGYPMDTWCVDQVTSLAGLFRDDATFNEDISSWTVSQVTDLSYTVRKMMFRVVQYCVSVVMVTRVSID